jgi:hypothetical protein
MERVQREMTLAVIPAKILAFYFTPSRPLIKSNLTACMFVRLSFMATNLNAKHVDWNSRLIMVRRKALA